jgi:hypothetical protein
VLRGRAPWTFDFKRPDHEALEVCQLSYYCFALARFPNYLTRESCATSKSTFLNSQLKFTWNVNPGFFRARTFEVPTHELSLSECLGAEYQLAWPNPWPLDACFQHFVCFPRFLLARLRTASLACSCCCLESTNSPFIRTASVAAPANRVPEARRRDHV